MSDDWFEIGLGAVPVCGNFADGVFRLHDGTMLTDELVTKLRRAAQTAAEAVLDEGSSK